MGKKGKWFNAVKKVFNAESKAKNDEKSKKKLELEASGQSNSFSIDSSAIPASETAPSQLVLQTEVFKEVEVKEQMSNADSEVAAVENSVETVQELSQKTAEFHDKAREERAATKIQTAFRGHKARRELKAERGLERLKSLLKGKSVKRQTTSTLHYMQSLARVQLQVRSRRIRMSEENQSLRCQMLLKHERELENLKMGEEWDHSSQTKEQIKASLLSKQEATVRRERAMAYSFNHQWKSSTRSFNPLYINPSNQQWGWSWLERWLAAKPCEEKKKAEKDSNTVVKSSNKNVGDTDIIKANSYVTVIDKPSPSKDLKNDDAVVKNSSQNVGVAEIVKADSCLTGTEKPSPDNDPNNDNAGVKSDSENVEGAKITEANSRLPSIDKPLLEKDPNNDNVAKSSSQNVEGADISLPSIDKPLLEKDPSNDNVAKSSRQNVEGADITESDSPLIVTDGHSMGIDPNNDNIAVKRKSQSIRGAETIQPNSRPAVTHKPTVAEARNEHAAVKSSSENVGSTEIMKANPRPTVAEKPSLGVQKTSSNTNRKSHATPPVKAPWTMSKRKSVGPKVGSVISEDDPKSIASMHSERSRRHSVASISVRDDESLASSPSFPSYMAPTVSTRARSRNQSPSNDTRQTPSTDTRGISEKPPSAIKRKSSRPASPSISRRYSMPPKLTLEPEKDVESHS